MSATLTDFRVVPMSRRIELRESFGDITAMFESALEEQAAGHLLNAKVAMTATLAEWLRLEWIAVSGKSRTPITDPLTLAGKLRSGVAIDQWTHHLIRTALKTPSVDKWLHVDLLAGVVNAVCFGSPTVSTKGGQRSCRKGNRSRDILVLVISLIVFTFLRHGSTEGVKSELRSVGPWGAGPYFWSLPR